MPANEIKEIIIIIINWTKKDHIIYHFLKEMGEMR